MVGKVVGPFRSWVEDLRRPVLKIGLGSRMGKQRDGPTLRPIISAENTRRPEDGYMPEHLTGVRHKLLSNPFNVKRLGPTSDKRFDSQ